MSPKMLPYSLRMTVSFLELQEHLEKAINTQPVKFSSNSALAKSKILVCVLSLVKSPAEKQTSLEYSDEKR